MYTIVNEFGDELAEVKTWAEVRQYAQEWYLRKLRRALDGQDAVFTRLYAVDTDGVQRTLSPMKVIV